MPAKIKEPLQMFGLPLKIVWEAFDSKNLTTFAKKKHGKKWYVLIMAMYKWEQLASLNLVWSSFEAGLYRRSYIN